MKEAKELLDSQNISAKEYAGIEKDILRIQAGRKTSLAAIIASSKTLNKELAKTDKLTQQIKDNEYELIDIVSTLQGDLVKNKKEFDGISKKTDGIVKNLNKQLKQQLANGKITKQQFKDQVASNNETAKLASQLETISKSDLAPIFQDATKMAEDMASSVEGVFNSLPGGGMLFNYSIKFFFIYFSISKLLF